MTTLGIVCCGLLGFVAATLLGISIRRSPAFPAVTRKLAPPLLLETLTAILCSALAWRIGSQPELLAYSWFAVSGVLLAAIDWRTHLLPTRLIWPSGTVLASLFGLAAVVNDDWRPPVRAAAAMLVLLAFYGTLYVARPGELGGGDLRLGAVIGLALGWAGWPAVAAGTLLSWIVAAVSLAAIRIRLETNTPRDLPLGPCMITGAVAGLLVGLAGY